MDCIICNGSLTCSAVPEMQGAVEHPLGPVDLPCPCSVHNSADPDCGECHGSGRIGELFCDCTTVSIPEHGYSRGHDRNRCCRCGREFLGAQLTINCYVCATILRGP
jgi:hypothetical protein